MTLRILAVCLTVSSVAACGDKSPATPPDAPQLPSPDASLDAAPPTPDAPADAAMSRLRIVHASPGGANLDVYIAGSSTPLLRNVAYGSVTAYATLPVGAVRLEVRTAGAAAGDAPLYTSDMISAAGGGAMTAVAAGLVTTAIADQMFRITAFADHFTAAGQGKSRVRIVDAWHTTPKVAVDLGDDNSPEIAELPAFSASDEGGLEVPAGADLGLSVKSTTSATIAAAFAIPAAALTDGGEVYVVVAGLTTRRPRDPSGAMLVIADTRGQTMTARINPTIYVLGAAADLSIAPEEQVLLDAFIGGAKQVDGLGFGTLKSVRVPPNPAGYMLDFVAHTTATTVSATPLLASLSTGPLAAGEQYLLVLGGQVGDASLALHPFKDQLTLDTSFRARVIDAVLAGPPIDVGWFDAATLTWHDVPDFANLAANAASPPTGTVVQNDGGTTLTAINGVRAAGDAATQERFAVSAPISATSERWYVVAAGAWSPAAGQVGPRLAVVKTGATTWTATTLAPLPPALASAQRTARRR